MIEIEVELQNDDKQNSTTCPDDAGALWDFSDLGKCSKYLSNRVR